MRGHFAAVTQGSVKRHLGGAGAAADGGPHTVARLFMLNLT